MYHYLKWAALSLFFKRNLRYIILILLALVGIYGADAVYRDFVDYFVNTGHKEYLLPILLLKWVFVATMIFLLIFSIMRLGFGRETKKGSSKKTLFGKAGPNRSENGATDVGEDAIMDRLEKFRHKKRLRHRSDLLVERRKKRK